MMNRIAIVDDEAIVRSWLQDQFSVLDDITLVLNARNADEFLEAIDSQDNQIDLVILDLALPGKDGLELLEEARNTQPEIKFFIYSQYRDAALVHKCLRFADAYMLKDEPVQEIIPAVRKVLDGGSYISPKVDVLNLDELEGPAQEVQERLLKLSQAEKEVVRCITGGMTSKEAAEKLQKSHRTVELQLQSVYKKLKIHGKLELLKFAMKANMIPED